MKLLQQEQPAEKRTKMNWFGKFTSIAMPAMLFFCGFAANAQQSICPRSSPEVKAALDMARTSAQQISDQYVRTELLHEVAKGYARNGDFGPALDVIHVDSALMWQAADDLAKNMLRCGQPSEVKGAALTLQGRSRPLMFQWLAEWEAKHNNQAESDAALGEIKDNDIRRDAEFNIIVSRTRVKDAPSAEIAFRKLLTTSPNGQESRDDLVSQDMAIVYVMNGDISGAIEKLDQIKGAEKVYALYVVTQVLAERKEKSDIGSFSKAVLRMTHPYLQDPNEAYPLSLIATALANLGTFDDAVMLANSIADEQRKTEALVMIAVRLVAAKDSIKANELLDSLPKVLDGKADLEVAREMAWVRVAIAEANAGDGDAALSTLEAVRDPRLNGLLKWQRAYALAQAGKFGGAEAMAVGIPQQNPSDERGHAFRLVASVLAHVKGASTAMSWAGKLTVLQDRTSAYLGIADGLLAEPNEEIPPYFQD